MSLERFDRKLLREGKTVKQWCAEQGQDYRMVCNVRCGINKARFGKGRAALQAMLRYAADYDRAAA